MNPNNFPSHNQDPFAPAQEAVPVAIEVGEKKPGLMQRIRNKLSGSAVGNAVALQPAVENDPNDPFAPAPGFAENAASIDATLNTQLQSLAEQRQDASIAEHQQVASGEVSGYQMQNHLENLVNAAVTKADYDTAQYANAAAQARAQEATPVPTDIDPFSEAGVQKNAQDPFARS